MFRIGYHECLTELMHFLVEKEGFYAGDSFCSRMMTHLQKHYDRLGRGEQLYIVAQCPGSKGGGGGLGFV